MNKFQLNLTAGAARKLQFSLFVGNSQNQKLAAKIKGFSWQNMKKSAISALDSVNS